MARNSATNTIFTTSSTCNGHPFDGTHNGLHRQYCRTHDRSRPLQAKRHFGAGIYWTGPGLCRFYVKWPGPTKHQLQGIHYGAVKRSGEALFGNAQSIHSNQASIFLCPFRCIPKWRQRKLGKLNALGRDLTTCKGIVFFLKTLCNLNVGSSGKFIDLHT